MTETECLPSRYSLLIAPIHSNDIRLPTRQCVSRARGHHPSAQGKSLTAAVSQSAKQGRQNTNIASHITHNAYVTPVSPARSSPPSGGCQHQNDDQRDDSDGGDEALAGPLVPLRPPLGVQVDTEGDAADDGEEYRQHARYLCAGEHRFFSSVLHLDHVDDVSSAI